MIFLPFCCGDEEWNSMTALKGDFRLEVLIGDDHVKFVKLNATANSTYHFRFRFIYFFGKTVHRKWICTCLSKFIMKMYLCRSVLLCVNGKFTFALSFRKCKSKLLID